MYGFHPYPHVDRLLPLTGSTAEAADRLTTITDIGDVVYELIKLLEERMAAKSTRAAPLFQQEIMFISRLKVYISGHINASSFATDDSVLSKLFVRLELTLTKDCCLRVANYIQRFVVTCYLILYRRHHCGLIRQKWRAATRSMHLILLMMLKLISD